MRCRNGVNTISIKLNQTGRGLAMKRIIYVAGVNRKHLAAAADECPYWLLSVTLLRKYPSWLAQYLIGRTVIWDPGTFSEDAVAYHRYRSYLDRYARSQDEYLQYDEIGDPEATAWYLQDMRRRGYDPVPILQPGGNIELLQEKRLAIGGLVRLSEEQRRHYLDDIFYNHTVTARVHLLGMGRAEWFEPYKTAVSGDNTSWIPRSEWNRRKTVSEWMQEYGEQWIPYRPRRATQIQLAL
jgi:hypothetical protein